MSRASRKVGRAIPHESAEGHVTGGALYTDDLLPRMHGALSAWPVLAPHARAHVLRVDTATAAAMPGVAHVLTAEDVSGENDVGPSRRDEPLFPTEVVYHGQAVAWVLAETVEQAKQAAAAVAVEYEPLDAILGIDAAIAAESYHTDELRIAEGDVDQVLSRTDHVLEGEVRIGGQEHFYLETQAAIVHADEAGEVFVHSSTQHPTETQIIVARVLGIDHSRVTCQSLRMGGAFGGKEVQANAFAAVAAVGARVTGRPVRVRLDRQRDMVLTGKRHPFLGRFRVGYDDRGLVTALDVQLYSDGGWSLDLSEPVLFRAMFHIDNCYRIPALRVTGRVCKTNVTSHTAFRGFGGPQGMVVVEEVLGRVAQAVGRPAHEVRRDNFYREGDHTHYGQPVTQADRIERIWDDVLAESSFAERWAAIEKHNATSTTTRRGLAITPVKFGISFTASFMNQAGALVLLYTDGTAQVNHGGTEMGQGLHTKMLQIAADGLGLPLERVRLMPTRTDKVPNTSATAASSGSDLNGAAVKQACEQITERLSHIAAQRLGCPADLVSFADGFASPVGHPDQRITIAELATLAHRQRIPLFATGYYRTPLIHYDRETGRGKPFHYYAYGAAVTEVEVDVFTGMFAIRRVDILHDVGDSISPLVDQGQVEGGFIQGLGWLTSEELVWTEDGRLATRGASTYKLPTLGECPEQFHVRLLPRAAEPGVVHGSKAVGEPPFMLAISVREALRHAVSSFAAPGRVIELGCPSTPEAVYWAIEAARAGSAVTVRNGRRAAE